MPDAFHHRLAGGFFAMFSVFALGTLGYLMLGEGRWSWQECLYMTVITLTTVGYGEVLPGFAQTEHVRLFTVVLIVMGMGTFLYFASTLTAFIIEGDLRRALQSKRMRKRLARIKNHVIVCGVGATGRHVVKQLISAGTPLVAIDTDEERLHELEREHGDVFLYVHGDATEDHVLAEARLDFAGGLVAALANDKDNLYLVVSARQRHPVAGEFRIVARGIELGVLNKLTRAGANSVVSPNYIGGMRMASEMIRPAVVKFLDVMLHDQTAALIGDVVVKPDSRLAGRSLGELDLRRQVNVSVLAIREPDTGQYVYNPGAEEVVVPGVTLVVLATSHDLERLRQMAQ